jgi:predicted DCC family thiol-disulfide oxidoreductase YuxK
MRGSIEKETLNLRFSRGRLIIGMPANDKLRVYTDGQCGFCSWARSLVEPYDTDRRIEFRDFNDPAVASETPYSDEQLAREMHVLTPEGKWFAGFHGWMAVLRVLPRRRWLARLLSVPPFRWIGPLLYRFVAANRYRIPGFILGVVGAPQPCDATCATRIPG